MRSFAAPSWVPMWALLANLWYGAFSICHERLLLRMIRTSLGMTEMVQASRASASSASTPLGPRPTNPRTSFQPSSIVRSANPHYRKLANSGFAGNGDTTLWLSPFNPTVDTVFTINDDRIAPITVSFEAGPGGNTAYYSPFPGKMILTQDTYSVSANLQKSNAVPIGALVPETGPNDMGAKNCNGDDVRVIVGVETEKDDLGTEYAVAFPRLGQAIACSS